MTNPPTKRRRIRRLLLGALCALLAAAVTLGGIYWWLYEAGRQGLLVPGGSLSAPSQAEGDGDIVEYNGVTYRYNEKVTAILVMGVDKQDIQTQGQQGINGQADSLFLLAMDSAGGTATVLPISREIMVDVDRYAADGVYLGSQKTQLCLAYANGSDAVSGCENVVRSVRRLLYGVPINSYMAVDMAGFKALTDAVGGVTLTALEDVEGPDGQNIKKGQTVTLRGSRAQRYIQSRGQDVEANNRRMARQKQFFGAFIGTAGRQLKKDFTKLMTYYNIAKPYVVSDLTLSQITYLATVAVSKNAFNGFRYLSITGSTVMGEEFVEFHADRISVYEAVLEMFYTPENS